MNTKSLGKLYDRLTPGERFRLILAASARGDEAERNRLVNAGQRLTLSMPDHAPYAQAFEELAFLVFMELLEDAARYLEAFARADEVRDVFEKDEERSAGKWEREEETEAAGDESEAQDQKKAAGSGVGVRSPWERCLDLALAAGYILRTKADGWKLFCERRTIPPFLLWEGLPGYDRLQRALKLAEEAAFVAGGFVQWLNTGRPAGEPACTAAPLTVEGMADDADKVFRQRVEWWGG
jgi:hypothetical protein